MKKGLLLLLLISVFADAQNKRFTYEYSFVLDSTNQAEVQKELIVLDVNPEGSKFYSYELFKSDSIQLVEIEKQANSGSEIINVKQSYKGKIFYTIEKSYPGFEIFQHTGLGNDRYKVLDNRKPVWKILVDKQKLGDFETQKADTEIFGRKWTAWFTTEIPIQDGPYKFHGLPGLIVKIEDEAKSHSFELKGISNYTENNKLQIEDDRNYEKEILIDQLKYKKLAAELRNDPTKSLREMLNMSGPNVKMISSDGREVKPAEILRERELKAKEDRKRNNNPLELDLLK